MRKSQSRHRANNIVAISRREPNVVQSGFVRWTGRCPNVGQILPQIRDDRRRDRSREDRGHVIG